MTGCTKHMCSAPRIGNPFKEKCLIISGIDVNGLLNWPRINVRVPFVSSRWILMCINPLALLKQQQNHKICDFTLELIIFIYFKDNE